MALVVVLARRAGWIARERTAPRRRTGLWAAAGAVVIAFAILRNLTVGPLAGWKV